MSYTLTYSEAVQGWPSFYSYYPDWIIGMNNYLYTFKGGDLYKHNDNNSGRNTFYQQWWDKYGTPNDAFTPSRLKSVFNASPLENKLFKTITLQGDSTWGGTFTTDLQSSGYIQSNWFEKKEQAYFAFIRNQDVGVAGYALRSLNGIGNSLTVTGGGTEINFSISPLIAIGGIISIGDYIYFAVPPTYNVTYLAGQVTNIIQNYPGGVNQVVIDTSISGTTPIPSNVVYIFYIKNSVAESHGVLGHYCVFDIENASTSKVELFALESNVMKSFP